MSESGGRFVRFDAEFLSDPFAAYARLREQRPVHWAVTPDGAGAWLVTRYAEARAALADPRLSVDKVHSRTGYRGFSLPPELDANLLNMDPPDHTRLRRAVVQVFNAQRVEGLRERVQQIGDGLLDGLAGKAEADLLAAFAGPLPIIVICELLGIDERDRPDFRSWTDAMLAPDPANPERSRNSVVELHRFLLDLVATKRNNPSDDLLSALIVLHDKEGRINADELISTAFVVLFAGYENTVNLLGNGLANLLARPALLDSLREDPTLLPAAVDELLRFDPPPQLAIRRFALESMEIGGTRIEQGDTVLVSLASAHRDPRRFPEPDELDFRRDDNAHLGFGHGPHFCIGATLGRMEVEIGIGALMRRFPRVALAEPPERLQWRPSFRNRGLTALPVTLT